MCLSVLVFPSQGQTRRRRSPRRLRNLPPLRRQRRKCLMRMYERDRLLLQLLDIC